MRNFLFFILILTSLTSFSQYNKAMRIYNKGLKAFEKKDYTKAFSLFTKSIKKQPTKDNYFYMAKTQEEIGNHCLYCEYMSKSFKYGKTEAGNFFSENCFVRDTFHYTSIKELNVDYFLVTITENCTKNKIYQLNKKEWKGGEAIYNYFNIDTIQYKVADFMSPVFEVEKIFKENTPYTVVQEMPSFLGGDEGRIKFITENIVYPLQAKEKNIQGTVYTTFIVETDGSLTDIRIFKGIGGGCDEECIRIIKLMPKWIPGKQNGKVVRVQYYLPIKFTLN
jgi:TonB family protein